MEEGREGEEGSKGSLTTLKWLNFCIRMDLMFLKNNICKLKNTKGGADI